jgi:hypothetical protein
LEACVPGGHGEQLTLSEHPLALALKTAATKK